MGNYYDAFFNFLEELTRLPGTFASIIMTKERMAIL